MKLFDGGMCVDGGQCLWGCGCDQGWLELEIGLFVLVMCLVLCMSDSVRYIVGVVQLICVQYGILGECEF